jgi:hypothetical protein
LRIAFQKIIHNKKYFSMSSELMKKISGQLTLITNSPLPPLPLGITIEMTTLASPPAGAGGWVGSAPIKCSGQFDLFTAYNISTYESVGYQIFKDGQLVLQGTTAVAQQSTQIALSDDDYAALIQACDCEPEAETTQISGRISNQKDKPISGNVKVYKVAINGRTLIATIATNAQGYYEYIFPRDTTKGVQVEISVAELTDPIQSEVFFNATDPIVADLTIPVDGSSSIPSEYQLLKTAISNISGVEYASLTLANAKFLSGATGQNEQLIRMLLLAKSFITQVTATEETLYGIMRITQLESLEVILNLSTGEMTNALKTAIALNTIGHYTDEYIDGQVAAIKNSAKQIILGTAGQPVATSKGVKILSSVITGTSLNQFLDYYYKNDTSDPEFWNPTKIIAAAPTMTVAAVDKVKTALSYALLTGNNPSIVTGLVTNTLDTNVAMTTAQWNTFVNTRVNASDFVFPEEVTGTTTVEKVANYSTALKENFEAAYKSISYKNAILAGSAINFPGLKANINQLIADFPTFDLLATPSGSLSSLNKPYISTDLIAEVATVQRLNMVTSSFSAITALKQAGITSAKDVVHLSQDNFVTTYSGTIGSTAAASVAYTNAMNTVMAAQAIALNAYGAVNLSLPAIYSSSALGQSDWRSLFGNVDFCSCDSCMSVFSPSAYFVDSLELLRKYNPLAYSELKARRPDLWNTKLTCKNTNTSLPYIDLVNEILEDMVKVSGTNAGTDPYYAINTGGLRNTELDEKTLHAIPEYINKETTGNPYQKLFAAKYPWTAPYNYFNEQTKEYLELINIAPYKISQAFAPTANGLAFTDIDAARTYLDITNTGEYGIITDNTVANVKKYYGLDLPGTIVDPSNRTITLTVPTGNVITTATSAPFMSRVDIFMQQSGLTLTDLLELLDCYYINDIVSGSGANIVRRLNITSDANAPCNTAKMTISGIAAQTFTETDLFNMHRFVRLQRKTGWSKYEFDRALKAIGVTAGQNFDSTIILAIAQLKRLTEVLNCAVADLLPFWGNIAYLRYSDYGGDKPMIITTQYENFFRNPAVASELNLISYPFPKEMNEWIDQSGTPAITQSTLDYILAAFQISGTDFNTLFKYFSAAGSAFSGTFDVDATAGNAFAFTYKNALALYREFTFCKLLQLNVEEWCILRKWMKDIGINPFRTTTINAFASLPTVLAFVDKLNTLRNAGLTISDLNYLFNDGYSFTSDTDKNNKQKALFTRYKDLRTLLAKLNTKVFIENTTDVDAKALLAKIGLILDPEDADFVVNIVAGRVDPDNAVPLASYTLKQKTDFIDLLPKELIAEQKESIAFKLFGTPTANTSAIGAVIEVNDRLKIVNDTYTQAALKGQIRSYLSATHKVDLAVSELLLSTWINVASNKTAYDLLLNEEYVNEILDIDTSKPYTRQVFQVLERFNKAAIIVGAASLTSSDIDFLENRQVTLGIPDIANLPVGNLYSVAPASPSTDTWMKLMEWLDVKAKMTPSPTGLFTVLKSVLDLAAGTSDLTKKTTWSDAFVTAMQISATDLEKLVGPRTSLTPTGALAFNFSGGTPYLLPVNYRRLLNCMDLQAELEVGMASCVNIATAVNNAAQQSDADFVVQAVKSRFNSDEWLEQVKPVSDRLRVGRRDAMVAYLLANPPVKYRKDWITSKDMFETLLIDTDMMPIVKTSRIKQAISSVQLFVDRCVLSKELNTAGTSPLSLSVETITQWNLWRKWYRIWEANRKIFVYPENWIEPDLRDDKSPIFKELEKFIKQNDITADTMADAYRTYLERLDDVSHLDVVGYFPEEIKVGNNVVDTIVHVWGRTKSNPHIYYYRKRVMKVWSAWEKMETQIDGTNFAPVKWRGRVRLYWVTTMEQSLEQISQLKVDDEQPASKKYLKIELCWTELKNGKWQPKQIGKEWLETEPDGAWTGGDIIYNLVAAGSWAPYARPFTPNTFTDSLNYLKANLTPYCRINTENDLEIIVIGKRKYASQVGYNAYSPSGAQWRALFNNNQAPWANVATSDNRKTALREMETFYNANFKLETYLRGRFTVKHNKIIADKANVPSTYYDTLVDSLPYKPTEGVYQYDKPKLDGYKHQIGSSALNVVKLLGEAPAFDNAPSQTKQVVFSKMIPANTSNSYVAFPKFFYKDYRNSFFVEKVSTNITNASVTIASPPVVSGYSSPLLTGVNLSATVGVSNSSLLYNGNVSTISTGSSVATLPGTAVFSAVASAATSTDRYRFYPFYHYKVSEIMDRLDSKGLDGLFDWSFINDNLLADNLQFSTLYKPTANVTHYDPATSTAAANDVYPKSKLEFSNDSPTAIYNWELFFHIPLLIANKLMQDQKFDEALKWFHYVFNPSNRTGTSQGNGPERFWQFLPFRTESLTGPASIDDVMASPGLQAAVDAWAKDPFKPHLVARTRISAYMKNVLMKYLDNLIAWGDQLFRRDTMESINEATLLYVLAAQILGKPPVKVPTRLAPATPTYFDLTQTSAAMNAFSNALVAVESVMAPTGMALQLATSASSGSTQVPQMRFFCIPPNEKLLSYWDLVADRLFKIHNSQNIDGVERQLALFEPPIDPALLVRAAASGLSLSDAVNELFAPMPQYRFVVMQQKAAEMVQEVKSLGSSLLSAIEKKDAEHLSLLRSTQEINVMDNMRELKQYQLQEAQVQIAALQDQKDNTTIRRDYYNGLVERGLNANEQSQLDSIQASIPLKINEGLTHAAASVLFAWPDLKAGGPFTLGATAGGTQLGNLTNAAAAVNGIAATVNDIRGSMAGIKGGYARRLEDWKLQLKLADGELKQIEKQLVAAEIRASISAKEIQNQELQFNNAIALDAAMRDKYSNEDLYDWMITEISMTYFQSYKLAFDLAKRAERCYSFELGITPTTPFIQFGYWNSLKKGLLAGEGLAYDIKRMDSSYLDLNKRQHELSKHISLAALDSSALFDLKSGRKAAISIPEWLFDMDYPGHYFRRIKSVSISIPCVAGPYSTVSAKLSLNNSKYRKTAVKGSTANDYKENGNNDSRFSYMVAGGQSIATSSAQNDGGMFEMNFRDERYLPFEGAGVISNWTLELPSKYASFDRDSINDVIIHIQYTAKYDGALITGANARLDELVNATANALLPRLFNVKQEFSDEWNTYLNAVEAGNANAVLSLPISSSRFPMFSKGRAILVKNMLFKVTKTIASDNSDVIINNATTTVTPLVTLTSGSANPYQGSAIGVNISIAANGEYVLNLSFNFTGISSTETVLKKLKNLDAVWMAAIYSLGAS